MTSGAVLSGATLVTCVAFFGAFPKPWLYLRQDFSFCETSRIGSIGSQELRDVEVRLGLIPLSFEGLGWKLI